MGNRPVILSDDPGWQRKRSGPPRFYALVRSARVSCGGTRLRRTGEVGRLTLKRDNIGKDRERIEVHATVDEIRP